ncbi:MAG: flagellar hook assembly protein FlgD [Thermomicrobiales bacterium]
MEVTGTTATQQTTAASASSANSTKSTLDYNAFLQLLIAQLQNQDPMEPMKSTDYVAQLATFSQVEKTVQTNERIASLLSAVQLQQAEGVIGRNITSADGSISGVVTSSKVVDNNVVAVLADGQEVKLAPGVVLSGG